METYLEEVVFCILEDHNSAKWHNPRGNVEPFRDVQAGPARAEASGAGRLGAAGWIQAGASGWSLEKAQDR
eukprot:14631407-Alexandrium_andersonii.AAC.1